MDQCLWLGDWSRGATGRLVPPSCISARSCGGLGWLVACRVLNGLGTLGK